MSNMVVQTNILALNAHRNMKGIGNLQKQSSERLTSGFKINKAADDAAGLAISEKMRSQIRGLDMASKNAQDGISLIQTAEGGLSQVNDMMQRIRELAIQGANDTNTNDDVEATGSGVTGAKGDRSKVLSEMKQLIEEINVTSEKIKFNNRLLLDGSMSASNGGLNFQVGSNAESTTSPLATAGVGVNLLNVNVSVNLGAIATALDVTTAGLDAADVTANDFNTYVGTVEKQLTSVIDARAKLGAYQNRMEYTIKANDIASENITDAESRIRNTDMAKEMMNLTKANVLQQATVSMLAQANQAPQSLLSLLR